MLTNISSVLITSRSGFERASKNFQTGELDGIRLDGRVALVTGANSGIGYCCALALARSGAKVHMLCRNSQRAEEAKKSILDAVKDSNISIHGVDMSEPRQVATFCRDFCKENNTLNILINNAGCMVNTRTLNSDGMETNFATNTLATYLITTMLLPLLKSSEDPRVITVSSGGMLTQKLNAHDPELRKDPIANENFDGASVYAQNKRQQVVMTDMWAEECPEVFFATMHPGWADTPGVAYSMPTFYETMKGKLRTPEQGADTAIWLAMTPRIKEFKSGSFFLDRGPVATHLTLAQTHSTEEEKRSFTAKMATIAEPYIHP
ncbi:hypothetical protein Aperf_G00000096039 [Anoplocephala perfoliata]